MPSLVKIDLEKTTTTTMTTYNGQKAYYHHWHFKHKDVTSRWSQLDSGLWLKRLCLGIVEVRNPHWDDIFFCQKQHFAEDTNISALSTKVCIHIASEFCSFKGILESILMEEGQSQICLGFFHFFYRFIMKKMKL